MKYQLQRIRNKTRQMRRNWNQYRDIGIPRRQAALSTIGGGALTAHTSLGIKKIVDGVVVEERTEVRDKVVTDAFVAFVVDQLQAEDSTIGDFKFHEMGVGVGAEAAGDTALGTTTGIARVTGTQVEGATGNIYKSVGTITADATEAITEHGLFNIVTAGTLMDRTVFSAINVVSGNQIEFTFQITLSSGG